MEMNNISGVFSSPLKKPNREVHKSTREIEEKVEEVSQWEFLTTEILHHIFQFLTYEELLRSSLVCRIWRNVILMERINLTIIAVDETSPTRFLFGSLYKGMTIYDTAKTVCKKAFNSSPSENFSFFHKGYKLHWIDNFHTLQQFHIKDGDMLAWKFSFIRAFIYDSVWYPSPPYKQELQLEYHDTIGNLRREIVQRIGHKPHAFDVLYRGIKYPMDTKIHELMPHHRNKIIFNVVRRPGASASDFSSLSDKDRHNRRLHIPPIVQDYPTAEQTVDALINHGPQVFDDVFLTNWTFLPTPNELISHATPPGVVEEEEEEEQGGDSISNWAASLNHRWNVILPNEFLDEDLEFGPRTKEEEGEK